MLKLRKVVCVALLIVGVIIEIASTQDDEVCIPVRRRATLNDDGILSGPPATMVPGPPGKRGGTGLPGLPGIQGAVGSPGTCACDPNEIQQIRTELIAEITKNTETIANLTRQISALRVHPCDTKPCARGTCIIQESTYICLCPPAYEGRNCSTFNVESCNNPVGMKSGKIKDNQITASSSHNSERLPKYARLDLHTVSGTHRGHWRSGSVSAGEWIQVDFETITEVVAIITQGDPDDNQGITRFKISHGTSVDQLHVIRDNNGNDVIFQATPGGDRKTRNNFPHPLSARYIRLIAQEPIQAIELRMEYITC